MGVNPRMNRLQADFNKLRELAWRSPFVEILEMTGDPPERYELLLKCKGVMGLAPDGTPRYAASHRLRIVLPAQYPRVIPEFQMHTPVWHPNISSDGWVCMGHEGDRGYVPSMGLDDLVVRIIQIIRYENYSKTHALNQVAFNWAIQNAHLFPLDTQDIVSEDVVQISILDELNIAGVIDDDILNQINVL